MLFFWYSAYSHYFSDICQNGKKAVPGTNNEPEGILFPFFFSYHSSVLCETIKSPASVINTEVIHSRVKITFHFKGHLFSWSRKTWTVTESPESVSSLKILDFHTDVTQLFSTAFSKYWKIDRGTDVLKQELLNGDKKNWSYCSFLVKT